MSADVGHINALLLLVFDLLSVAAQGCPPRSSAPTSYRLPASRHPRPSLFSDGLRALALAVQLDCASDDLSWYPAWTAEVHPGAACSRQSFVLDQRYCAPSYASRLLKDQRGGQSSPRYRYSVARLTRGTWRCPCRCDRLPSSASPWGCARSRRPCGADRTWCRSLRSASRLSAVRSFTTSRSNSAMLANTPITIRPAAVDESIPSVVDTKVTPRSVRVLTVSRMCNLLRPSGRPPLWHRLSPLAGGAAGNRTRCRKPCELRRYWI